MAKRKKAHKQICIPKEDRYTRRQDDFPIAEYLTTLLGGKILTIASA